MAINPQAVRGPVTAVPVVAGKGVRFVEDIDNNRVVAEVDDTVLWDGSGTSSDSVTLSENATNFEYIELHMRGYGLSHLATVIRIVMDSSNTVIQINWSLGNNSWYVNCQKLTISGTSIVVNNAHAIHGSSFTSTDIIHESNTDLIKKTICKVVGVNRVSA